MINIVAILLGVLIGLLASIPFTVLIRAATRLIGGTK